MRQLERALGSLARKVALRFAERKTAAATITPESLADMLGRERFLPELARTQLPPGVATGLAWTEAGGDVLYVEAALLPEGRALMITGQLGEAMQESARAAQSYLWSHAKEAARLLSCCLFLPLQRRLQRPYWRTGSDSR